MLQYQEKLMRLHAEEKQLLDDQIRYRLRLDKAKRKLEEMQKNVGRP